jgi:aquaporin Z
MTGAKRPMSPAGTPVATTLRRHLPEYASEAMGLGLFMVSACGFAILLFHPASPVTHAIPDPLARRALMGLAMGVTLVLNVHAPWGRRSGAHLNPAATLAFWRLGHVEPADLLGYAAAQVLGGILGVAAVAWIAGAALAHPSVHYVVTQPGPGGAGVALLGELAVLFVMFSAVLRLMASPRHGRWTPWIAGALLAIAITFESPLSGTSLNPARTLGSAVAAHDFRGFWVYLLAPPLATLAAVEAWCAELRARRATRGGCAKLLHDEADDCIFCGQRGNRRAGRTGTSAGETAFTTGRRSA